MKIGILGHRFIEWGGGIDFLRAICESLAAADHPIELHVLIPARGPRGVIHGLSRRLRLVAKRLLGQVAPAPADAAELYDLSGPIAAAGRTIRVHEIDSGSAAIRNAFRQLELDILLPSFDVLTYGAEIPWLGYLYDMQHKYLPNFFSPRELKRRDSDLSLIHI